MGLRPWSLLLRNYAHVTRRFSQNEMTRLKPSSVLQSRKLRKEVIDAHDENELGAPWYADKYQNFSSCEEIFEHIRNAGKISTDDALSAMKAIHKLTKSMGFQRNDSIQKRQEFRQLCEILYKKIRALDTHQLVDVLKYCSPNNLNVPSSSPIVQATLQTISSKVNKLSVDQISFVHFLLAKMGKTPLSQALMISMPTVFEARVKQELPFASSRVLLLAYKYCMLNDLSKASLKCVIDLALLRLEEVKDSNLQLLCLSILMTKSCLPAFEDLRTEFQDLLACRIPEMSLNELRHILQFFIHPLNRISCPLNILEAMASRIISENLGYDEAFRALVHFNDFFFSNIPILDYIATEYSKDPTLIQSSERVQIDNLLRACCINDYRPIFWEALQDAIIKHPMWNTSPSPLDYKKLVTIAYRLNLMECYHPKPLEFVFKHIQKANVGSYARVALLSRNTKALNAHYSGPLLDEAQMAFIFSKHHRQPKFKLAGILEAALGGPEYFLPGVSTKYLQQLIDYVIVMREGGFPVAINAQTDSNQEAPKYLEDMVFPSGCQVILILELPRYAFPINAYRMRMHWAKTIKAVEALLGHSIVPINVRQWEDMPDRKKMPYLMGEIKLKTQEVADSVLVT